MNGSRVASSPLGSALWLIVSAALLIWAASTVAEILHSASQAIMGALGS